MAYSTGCMGINAPAMPKVQPMKVNIEPNKVQLIDKNSPSPVPAPTANVTTTQTTPPKYIYV